MRRNLLLALLLAMALTSCNNRSVEISGTLENPKSGEYIFLSELKPNDIVAFDSSIVTEEGIFNFNLNIKEPAFYLLKINQNNFLTMLLEPGEKINLNAPFDSLNNPAVFNGSTGTGLMIEYNRKLRNTINKMNDLHKIYAKRIDQPDLSALVDSLDLLAQGYLEDINTYTKKYIDDNLTSLVSLIALYQQIAPDVYVLNSAADIDYYRKVTSSMSELYPENEHVIGLQEQLMVLNENLKLEVDDFYGTGNEAPEIALPTPAGDTIKLSSTRGSFVLLDFWASWCPPCRQESPNLVKAYDLYHNKGFQIYQVSLDKNKEAWLKGIQDDKLEKWIHVSDVKYWNSVVVPLYKLESIPANFLLDENGRIIATNLRGDELQKKLEILFK